MGKRYILSDDQPYHPRKLANEASQRIYPRQIDRPAQRVIQPRHIPYSPTPLAKAPPTAFRLIIRLPPKPIDPVPIMELLHLFLSSDEPITLQLAESTSSVEAAIISKPEYSDHLERLIRGIFIDADVEQVPVDKNVTMPKRLVGKLERPNSPDIAPIRDVNSFPISPLASILQAGLPLADDERLVANFQIRPADPDRITAAQESLYKEMPMFNRLDPFEYLFRMIWGVPKVQVYSNDFHKVFSDRLMQPVFEVAGEVSLFGSNQPRLISKARTIQTVFADRYNAMFGGFILNDWSIRHGAEKQIFAFDGDNSMLLAIAEVASLWHPLSSDVRIPGAQFVTRREIFLPAELFQATGPIIGATRQRGEIKQVPLPVENFEYGPTVIIGPSGYGKSVLAENMLHQALTNNRHSAIVIDPHGSLVNNICARSLTQDRLNDVHILKLGDTANPVSLSFARGNTDIDSYISTTESTIKAMLADSYSTSYARMDEAIFSFVTAIAYIPNATLFHVYKLVKEKSFRQQAIPLIQNPIAQAWWRTFGELSDSGREALVAPLMARLGKLWRSKPIRNMILQPPPKHDPFSLLNNGGILLISLAGESIAAEKDFLYELILAKTEMALIGRFGSNQDSRVFLVADESQRASGATLTSIITQYRKVGVSTWLITQGLAGWSNTFSQVVLDNAATTIAFNPRDDAARLSHVFSPFTQHELAQLDPHEAVVKLTVNKSSVTPFTITTINVDRVADKNRSGLIASRSTDMFTRPRVQVEAEIAALMNPPADDGPSHSPPKGPRGRSPGSGIGDNHEG